MKRTETKGSHHQDSAARFAGHMAWTRRMACAGLAGFLVAVAFAGHASSAGKSDESLVRLAVDYIDSVLDGVAASTASVAGELANASRTAETSAATQGDYWRGHSLRKNDTVLLQTWPGATNAPPPQQSEMPAILSYRGDDWSDPVLIQIGILQKLTPVVRAAYHAYPFSWSYVTTANDLMLIYPFLSLDEAVNNDPPSRQIFYQRADFEHRKAGWTAPYLDLVGAGMMVTVSTPAYDGDTLLGVVSHDITLAQLSEKVLIGVTRDTGGTAWLVDESGLVIGVSDPGLARELDAVNSAAGAAVLHYRSPAWRQGEANSKKQISRSGWINEVTEIVIERVENLPKNEVLHFERDGHNVFGARADVANWHLIWMTP